MGPGVTPIVSWVGPGPGRYQPGGFGTRGDGLPDFDTMPAGMLSTNQAYRYSSRRDALFTKEEREVAGLGDSCYASAGS
jgi:hypothetical protein